MGNKIRLYRYLGGEAAIKTFEEGRMRVGRLVDLNDPFEAVPGLMEKAYDSEREIEDAQNFLLERYNEKYGLICFSAEIHDPVIWSHYADSHRGIAFGIDSELSNILLKVEYKKERVIGSLAEFDYNAEQPEVDQLFRLLAIKAPSWAYEKEYRFVIQLDQCKVSGGYYYLPIGLGKIKEVVVGMRCPYRKEYFERLFRSEESVVIKTAKRSLKEFKIVTS